MFNKEELIAAQIAIDKKIHVKLQKLRQFHLDTVYFQVLCSDIKILAEDLLFVSIEFTKLSDKEKNL